MIILQIKSYTGFEAVQANQITAQEGWDFRNTVGADGYVWWAAVPQIRPNGIFLRGEFETHDLELLQGTFDPEAITKFFNSPASPLDLSVSDAKPHYSSLTQEDLDNSPFEGAFINESYIVVYGGKRQLYLTRVMQPFDAQTTVEFMEWLLSKFSLSHPKKKEVSYTCEQISDHETLHTWTL